MEVFKRRNHLRCACPFSSFSEPVPQPILSAECRNKTVSIKCEVKQKTKNETFTIELTQDKIKKIRKNETMLEMHTRNSGTFRCVVKNQVSEKMAEKVIKCSGKKKNLFLPESARVDAQCLTQLRVSVGLVQMPGALIVPDTRCCKSATAAVNGSQHYCSRWDVSRAFCLVLPSLVAPPPCPPCCCLPHRYPYGISALTAERPSWGQ